MKMYNTSVTTEGFIMKGFDEPLWIDTLPETIGRHPDGIGRTFFYTTLPLPPLGQNDTLKVRCVKGMPMTYDDPLIDKWKQTVFNYLRLPEDGSLFKEEKVVLHMRQFMAKDDHDIDSYLKKLQDVLEGYAYRNDKQIVKYGIFEKYVAGMCYVGRLFNHQIKQPYAPHAEILVESLASYNERNGK